MICETAVRTGMLFATAAMLGCQSGSRRNAEVDQQSTQIVLPSQLLGRQRCVVNDDLAVYAIDLRTATDLAQISAIELAAFRARHPGVRTTKGFVIAIEPGDEPSAAVNDWESRIADRASRDIGSQPPSVGRPYAFLREPYFRESFALPRTKTDEPLCPKAGERLPGWICFLTTDPHFDERFDQARTEIRQGLLEATKQMLLDLPPLEALTQTSVAAAVGLTEELLCSRFRSMDLELMHLQRRETLWATWLAAGVDEASARQAALAELRARIGAEWERIWNRRPQRPLE